MANIQWYPGHMNKAKNQIIDILELVDVVIEVVDARIPLSSRNPLIEKLAQKKQHLIVLNKADLADPVETKRWVTYFSNLGHEFVIALDAKHNSQIEQLVTLIKQATAAKTKKIMAKGALSPTIRAVCVGIPNCGKSTILNRLVGKNVAVVGDRPGVTKNQNWLKAKGNIQVLDTPGILWPKFDDQEVGYKLAACGAIKDSIFHADDVAIYLLDFLKTNYTRQLREFTRVTDLDAQSTPELLLQLTKQFGYRDDYDRFALILLQRFRKLKLGRISLDWVAHND
ncbi:50s ribosomal subunit maturation gtpase rbga [Amylolactobacillus amylotrophicus DSM 20534]|uniref:Ribosome biogenesis GTPase YlqF n=3 Tax=Amylolactobacillus TaxID=2767876 RepID=A0A1L6XDW6_9LACO|nr:MULTISPECIES: ribosome biogenesis GTPase YlqF [Amylolactobacillus]APT19182.1 ribosome biogenesis GTPase YlqF [Amylolactobacillus amylophilus DSM 20533 = JCM 1125]KRK38545.1 50s ribosomal subunit maturation gtpase rbga [Amylolactobacillus amylotrophicus DSM 20534]KRM42812.1 50s ribosomal subunit maturation gtpase rbga [Amylolactobacillus amylophilus DSM 20533 = JCM 1125]GED79675.1 ribosome biogenesis GTPase A [Amylolactobacillus amylophilus]